MESINFVKGYGKVKPSDEGPNSPPTHCRRRCRIIAVSLAVLLTLAVVALIAALIRHSAAKSAKSTPAEPVSTSAESLKTVCAVTRYPDSCLSSLSPLNSPPSTNPFRFFNLSLHASLLAVSRLKDLAATPKPDPGVSDCAELIDDAASQLGRSAELICVGPGEKVLTEMRRSSLQTWISAAMTDQDTCLEGLEEAGSTALIEFRMKAKKSQEYMSNTLAILNNIEGLSEKFGVTTP